MCERCTELVNALANNAWVDDATRETCRHLAKKWAAEDKEKRKLQDVLDGIAEREY